MQRWLPANIGPVLLKSFSALSICICVLQSCATSNEMKKPELLVSSAISMKEALGEIAKDFETAENCSVTFNYASTGQLAAQLKNGAPVDVFISASPSLIEQLSADKFVDTESLSTIAKNKLVLIGTNKKFQSLNALLTAETISIGNPETVPAGTYAAAALRKAGIYDQLLQKKKLVFAENARQILTYVEHGDAEAGIVYNTDAQLCSACQTSFEISDSDTGPVLYKAGIVSASKNLSLAKEFMSTLKSQPAKDIFKRRGFVTSE